MKFYAKYDEIERTWDIYQEDGGKDYDTFMFSTPTEDDAADALKLINGILSGGYT